MGEATALCLESRALEAGRRTDILYVLKPLSCFIFLADDLLRGFLGI